MTTRSRRRLSALVAPALALAALLVLLLAGAPPARAGTTGTITGTVTDGDGHAVPGVRVSAASPSGSRAATTDAQGFFALQALIPDTYVLSFEAGGYQAVTQSGVTVQQDLVVRADQRLARALQQIGRVRAAAGSNLVKPYEGQDVYNVSGTQLNAATGGDNLHKTVYEYLTTVPGLVPIGGGYPAEPSIRGGQDTDNGYEYDGIPIQERITGYFTSNLSNLGVGNVEVYTGGLNARNAGNGTGVINSVIKTGRRPGFGTISFGATTPDFNHYLTVEYGNATPNNRFSYYVGFDGVNSDNAFFPSGATYYNLGINSTNPGNVYTRDLVGNFHYRPSDRDDFQFLAQNSLFVENNTYLLNIQQPGAPALRVQPCPGAHADGSTDSGASGGTAPNGQPCPAGLYFAGLPSGQGAAFSHYGGLGKLQWNHVVSDKQSFSLRVAENYNAYVFDQPVSDLNLASFENANPPVSGTDCPAYPYAAGSPVVDGASGLCTADLGDYYQNRTSHMYFASLDYTATPNQNLTLNFGAGQEYDVNYRNVDNLIGFGADGTYPQYNALSDFPTHIPFAYAQASINAGRFTLEPGLRWSRIWYGLAKSVSPGGSISTGAFDPTFAGTYRANPANVVRFSYGATQSFIGTEFVYRARDDGGANTYDPSRAGFSYQPQLNHNADLMLEHTFGPGTSLRFGPWYRHSTGYFQLYRPVVGTNTDGTPKYASSSQAIPSNGGENRAFGFELGFTHEDRRPVGASLYFAATYDNLWTTSVSQVSFSNTPLPPEFTNIGIRVRNPNVPLIGVSASADLHRGPWHFLPLVEYAGDTYFNAGQCLNGSNPNGTPKYTSCFSAALPRVLAPTFTAKAYWAANATLLRELGKQTVGLRVTNLFDRLSGAAPCYAYTSGGCAGTDGPGSGLSVTPGSFVYQDVSQNPRRLEVFATTHF